MMKRLLLLVVVAILSLQADLALAGVDLSFDSSTRADAQARAAEADEGLGPKLLASEFKGKSLSPDGKHDVVCMDKLESALGVAKGSIIDDINNTDGV